MANLAKKNDTNNFAKRTASTIKSILNSNNIYFTDVYNDGDNNQFSIMTPNTVLTKMKLKQAGFIRLFTASNSITIKCH